MPPGRHRCSLGQWISRLTTKSTGFSKGQESDPRTDSLWEHQSWLCHEGRRRLDAFSSCWYIQISSSKAAWWVSPLRSAPRSLSVRLPSLAVPDCTPGRLLSHSPIGIWVRVVQPAEVRESGGCPHSAQSLRSGQSLSASPGTQDSVRLGPGAPGSVISGEERRAPGPGS